jgi:autonomous glycyl radical cofactor GrcA
MTWLLLLSPHLADDEVVHVEELSQLFHRQVALHAPVTVAEGAVHVTLLFRRLRRGGSWQPRQSEVK